MTELDRYRRFSHIGTSAHYAPLAFGERSFPSHVSHAVRSGMRTCPVTRQNRSSDPAPEPETDLSNGQPRRRIAVACARCRKRKIRCSGDPGNGSGCQNCRTAGADITQCQFHRVGSFAPGPPAIFSYPSSVQASSNLSMSGLLQGHGGSYGHYKSYSPPQTFKSSYAFNWSGLGYGDESPTDSYNYGYHSTLPAHDSVSAYYGSADNFRGWSVINQKPASSTGGYLLDQETPASYNTATYLTTPVTRQPTVTTDNMSAFGMNSLQSSLPAPVSLEHRHLPVPTARRVQGSTASINDAASMRPISSSQALNATSMNSNSTYPRGTVSWVSENGTPQDIGRQATNVDATASEIMPPPPSNKNAAASANLQDAKSLNYSTSAPETAPASNVAYTSSCVYTPQPRATGRSSAASSSTIKYPNPAASTSTLSTTPAEETVSLSRSSSSSNMYSYSADPASVKRNSYGENDTSTQEGALVSGQRYAPLPVQHSASSEGLRRNSLDRHIVPTHQTSLTNLSGRNY